MLHVGSSIICEFSDSLRAEWTVRPPSNNVAANPDDATANAIWLYARIEAKVSEIWNVLRVPLGASKKKIPP